MPVISNKKKEKISEQIISTLYLNFPKSLFTSKIAEEIARDEEFTKKLLEDLKSKKIVISITKNNKGVDFLKRIRWRLSNQAHKIYSSS